MTGGGLCVEMVGLKRFKHAGFKDMEKVTL